MLWPYCFFGCLETIYENDTIVAPRAYDFGLFLNFGSYLISQNSPNKFKLVKEKS